MHRVSTPDQASTISALIAERAMCLGCLATSTATTPEAVDAALSLLGQTVKIDRYPVGMCLECGAECLVFAIDRPPAR